MKQKIKIQEGFIQIPLLIIIVILLVGASVGTVAILHKQGKLSPPVANISEIFKGKPTKVEQEIKPEVEESQINQPEIKNLLEDREYRLKKARDISELKGLLAPGYTEEEQNWNKRVGEKIKELLKGEDISKLRGFVIKLPERPQDKEWNAIIYSIIAEKEKEIKVREWVQEEAKRKIGNEKVSPEVKGVPIEEEAPQKIQEEKEVTEEKEILVGTRVKGIISSDITWTLKNSPYIIADNVLVAENTILTIEPGVEIIVNIPKYIQVMGTLKAIGTKEHPIIFTSSNFSGLQHWELKVGKYREGNKGGNLQLGYCKIKYGVIRTESYAYGNRDFNNLMIENCTFDTSAISTEGPGIRSYIRNNTFQNNINVAIYINTGKDNPLNITRNIFEKNRVAISIGAVSPTGVQIHENNFYLNNNIALRTSTKDDVNVSGNWWGTTDPSIIDSKIDDFYDDFDLGKINYQPIATSEISDAGAQ